MKIQHVPINKIKRDPTQPRQFIDTEKVNGMAQSILTEGVINPIEIDKNFVIITGELRWRAAKQAGLAEMPVRVIKIDPKERFRRQVIENIHHNTMTDWDTAKALWKLLKTLPIKPGSIGTHGGQANKGYSMLAKLIGKSQAYVSEKMELLTISPALSKAVQKGMSGSYVRAYNTAPPEFKKEMEQKIISGQFPTRDIALEVAYALKRNPENAKEILKANSREQLFKIAPRSQDIVKERLKPASEFIHLQKAILEWLKQNEPETIVHKDRFLVLLGMSTIVDNLNAWGVKANQLQLKN